MEVRPGPSMLALALALHALAQDPSTSLDVEDSGAVATTEIGTVYDIGIGLSVGNPSALSGKIYLDGRKNAIEAALGTETWGPGYGGLYLHGAWMTHPSTLLYEVDFEMTWHVGAGAFVNTWGRDPASRVENWGTTRVAFGPRAQIGVDADFTVLPFQIFADAGLNMMLFPDVWPTLSINAGVRYYF